MPAASPPKATSALVSGWGLPGSLLPFWSTARSSIAASSKPAATARRALACSGPRIHLANSGRITTDGAIFTHHLVGLDLSLSAAGVVVSGDEGLVENT